MRFILYLIRWQLSGVVLYPVLLLMLPHTNELWATITANFVGGCLFFFVDRSIFRR